MQILDDEFKDFKDLSYERKSSNRFILKDNQNNNEIVFNTKKMKLPKEGIIWEEMLESFESSNDFSYISGHGFYLEGYAEFKITGFWDDDGFKEESSELNKRYIMGNTSFELGCPSNLFDYITRFEDETKVDYLSIKLFGLNKENILLELEKAIFLLAQTYSEFIMEEYREFLYPRIVDIREVGCITEPFTYTDIDLDFDWSSPHFQSISQFNQGESSDSYDYFGYYRFIESFFGDNKEEDEIVSLVESINYQNLVDYASQNQLIDKNNATPKALARKLYQVRNNYVHHKLKGTRLFDPTFNVPVLYLSKWKVVSREIAIQLMNKHCK